MHQQRAACNSHHGYQLINWQRTLGPTVCMSNVKHTHAAQIHRVNIRRLKQLMRSGDMMLPSVSTCSFALDELSTRGLL